MDYDFISGEGDFIFFLHGWGSDKRAFYCVKNYLKNNLVFLSFSGFGESEVPKTPYFVKDYALEVVSLISTLAKGKKVILVCHSFGARVGSIIASEFNNLVKKMVIVDGAGLKPRRGLKYHINVFKYKIAKRKVNKGKLDKSALDKYGSSDYKGLCPIMKQTFVNVVNQDLKNYFKNIKCPCLLFYGKNDKDTPLYMAKKLNRLIKDSGLIVVDGGHFSYLDRFDIFIRALSLFVGF